MHISINRELTQQSQSLFHSHNHTHIYTHGYSDLLTHLHKDLTFPGNMQRFVDSVTLPLPKVSPPYPRNPPTVNRLHITTVWASTPPPYTLHIYIELWFGPAQFSGHQNTKSRQQDHTSMCGIIYVLVRSPPRSVIHILFKFAPDSSYLFAICVFDNCFYLTTWSNLRVLFRQFLKPPTVLDSLIYSGTLL